MKQRILLFIDWFDPGYKAGGPIRSAVNFVKHMQADYEVFVFTGDRDLGATAAYGGIKLNEWIGYGESVSVFYCTPEQLKMATVARILEEVNPAVIYLNSMFSKYFTIYPLLVSKKKGWPAKVVLAPRGMLRSSALRFKPLKKKLYLSLFRVLGLNRHIRFQATDDTEFTDIRKNFGQQTEAILAPNWPGYIPPYPGSLAKKPGQLNVLFVGRLHPIKNLDVLLTCLQPVQGDILLTIVGNEEDKTFVSRCRQIAEGLSAGIRVDFRGEIPNHKLPAIIAEHHIFGLPTQGENFGHAIFEALAAGKPALISDQTPWRGLSDNYAGWDLSLARQQGFTEALQQAAAFGQEEYDKWSKGAWQFVQHKVNNQELKIIYQKLFI